MLYEYICLCTRECEYIHVNRNIHTLACARVRKEREHK